MLKQNTWKKWNWNVWILLYIFQICRYWCIPLRIRSPSILTLWPSKTQVIYFRHWSFREKYDIDDLSNVARILAVQKLLTRTQIFKSLSFNAYKTSMALDWPICNTLYIKASDHLHFTISPKLLEFWPFQNCWPGHKFQSWHLKSHSDYIAPNWSTAK